MQATDTTPRIYVACLASYNAGKLYGRWIDATQDADDIAEEVQDMLKGSPEPGAEEWAIHDYEGFNGLKLGEWESFETVAALAALLDEHGDAFAAFYSHDPSRDLDTIGDDFEEAYAGTWDSLAEYAQNLAEDIGTDIPNHWPFLLIDWDAAGRELEIGGDIWTDGAGGGTIHVFRNI